MAEPVVSVEHLGKRFRVPLDRSSTLKYRATHLRSTSRYHDLRALDDVSFEVAEGEFLGVIGHNGCGKTTLLKILSGIYTPTEGVVRTRGRTSPFLELGVGFNVELNARENIRLSAAILGITRAELDERRVDEIIEFAELQSFADQKLKNYSSGMQVRLAFSVAIQADAAILLMDEVLAVGDSAFQQKCFQVFNRYRSEGRTVILVTHDLAAVEVNCDRAILLDHGRVVVDGSPSEACMRYRRAVARRTEAGRANGGRLADYERSGSWRAEITDVELLDGGGEPTTVVGAGAPLTVRVHVHAREAVGPVAVGIAVRREEGLLVSGVNTLGEDGVAVSLGAGEAAAVDYEIPSLLLNGGHYLLTVALYDDTQRHCYDQHVSAWSFRVLDAPFAEAAGVTGLGGRWRASSPVAT